jgi:hypothetical protein
MSLFRTNPPRRVKSFVPRLEAFEDRCLPSCTATASGGVLTILGDARVNNVAITDNGTNGPGSIVVQCDGARTSFSNITKVVINTKGGADRVEYDIIGNLQVSREIDVNLGAGNDSFHSIWQGAIQDGVALTLNASGGAGQDFIAVNASANVNIPTHAEVSLTLDGNLDKDRLFLDYRGKLDGLLDVLMTGGINQDQVQATISAAAGSAGQVQAAVEGNAGDDDLALLVDGLNATPAPASLSVSARVDGGAGHDICHATPNVAKFNCEA